ncbi:naringenin 7-O-methyltransferase [Oryza glaberrima]|uniref:O-methyltransferase domain-containing protein n=1 Tax=Oryza glaberrima TaxID=4538 RepID=I1R570_ORYGL|nr:naringenin 7-O-methyltransferase [Oryza glaberrima]
MGDRVSHRHETINAGGGDDDDQACMYALELLGGSVVSMTLKAAIELGLVDELLAAAGAAVTAEELAARLRLPAAAAGAAVDRMLRLLASYGVVRCATEAGPDGKARRSYAAAPVCKWLAAGSSGEGSMAPLGLLNLDKVFMENWYYLKEAVSEGGTAFDKAYGMPMFQYLAQDGNEPSNTLFNQAMASHSVVITNKLLQFFRGFDDGAGVDVLVDVGGGTGATLRMITARHPHLRGVNYDLPHVIAQAPPVEGVEHVGGSMFDHVPSGSAILLKWILHLWGDEECVKILKNCYKALPAKGKVILVEYVLPASPEATLAAQEAFRLDVMMLNRLAGGKERTQQEFTDLAVDAGFSGDCKPTYIFTNVWALEFTK